MKNWIYLAAVSILLGGCEKQVITSSQLKIETLCLGPHGCFSFESYHTLVLNDSLQVPIEVTSNTEAQLYYSYLNEPFRQMPKTGLIADSNKKYLFFIAENGDLGNSAQKRIELLFGNHSYLENLEIEYKNSELQLHLNSPSRGVMALTIFNLNGVNIGTQYLLINEDNYKRNLDLAVLEAGIYVVKVQYGKESRLVRIIVD